MIPTLILSCLSATAVPPVSNDNGRYLMHITSSCRRPVDVYLRLRFHMPDGSRVEDWDSLRFIVPGKRFLQLAYPVAAKGFKRVEIAVEEAR